jgi:AraC family transcriptional regulator of arabinose operon
MKKDKKDFKSANRIGHGKKVIVIPEDVLCRFLQDNPVTKPLSISELRHCTEADKHFCMCKEGCPEMVLILCFAGRGKFKTGTKEFEVLPGQFFILSPLTKHQYEADESNPWEIYYLKIGGEHISKYCQQPSVKKSCEPLYIKDVMEVRRLLDDLIGTLQDDCSYDRLMYANLSLQRIMALLFYGTQDNGQDEEPLSKRVICYMRENLQETFALDDLAGKFSYSASQFSSIFRQETGRSPMNYFLRLKMDQACIYLNTTNMKIIEVAMNIGYTDPCHFSKIFKCTMNVSPDQYRLLSKNKAHPG